VESMARITIEDCLDNVENMYELVLLTTRRARQLFSGADPLVKSKNRTIVTALREVASGQVRPAYDANDLAKENGDARMPN
jgi:DNA-directed RNA polymerase subunit omega